ncbi:BgtAc-31526 [Blumeria graminis f. sp. tritici]|uniref:BgtAc-31526 n=2 Tax=Blumeria graminis f. sp. tritici TaxID=62690 RepID=A0A9X9MEZ6_BLUGR|nr:BgtAc-31526 [Blumeria graminis f. sp. tritici]
MIGNGSGGTHYNVYEPQTMKFPEPPTYIRSNRHQASLPATYYRLYCSAKFNSREIVQNINTGMKDFTSEPYPVDRLEREKTEKCRTHITILHNKGNRSNMIKYSKISKAKCPPKSILSLADSSYISLNEFQNNLSPKNSKAKFQVIIDDRFQMKDLITRQFMFQGSNWLKSKVALAWYQGNLHLFQQKNDVSWYILTEVGQAEKNAGLLYYFVLGKDATIWRSNNLYSKIKERLAGVDWKHIQEHYTNQIFFNEDQVQTNLKTISGALVPTVAEGRLSAVSRKI